MIGILFAYFACSLQECSTSAKNINNVQTMKSLFNIECNSISLTNITSAAGSDAFWEADNYGYNELEISASFTNCDFSQSSPFISFIGSPNTGTKIVITDTLIGAGFKGISGANELTLVNCLINITAISAARNTLSALNITFIKCRFIGTLKQSSLRNYALFPIQFLLGFDEIEIKFIDCEFNLDEDWNVRYEEDESTISDKQFIVINNPAMYTVNISFIRCFTNSNLQEANYKFIKICNLTDNENNVKIVGEDNGFPIEWSTVSSEDELYRESDWEVLFNGTDYRPTEEPSYDAYSSDSQQEDSGESAASDSSNNSKTWMIVAIVFAAAFVVAVVALVIVLVLKRKKYDRSENE